MHAHGIFNSIRSRTQKSLEAIHNEYFGKDGDVGERTFSGWHAMGSKFIALAAGGSIYILIVIAGLGLQSRIGNMVGTLQCDLATLFRNPPEGMSDLL